MGWGRNNVGQLDIPQDLTNVVAISAKTDGHVMALKSDGEIVFWGRNDYGESNSPSIPEIGTLEIPCDANGAYPGIAESLYDCSGQCAGTLVYDGCNYCGSPALEGGLHLNFECVCIDEDCSLECLVEENCLGQCGIDIDDSYCLDDLNANLISSGGFHNLAINSDQEVFAWGRNNDGEINVPLDLNEVIKVATGEYHSLALKSDGTVVAWGENDNGQISVPEDLTNVIDISGGENHSLALKSDGTVVAWGHNNTNQLDIPSDLNSVVAISAGNDHNLALKADGTVVTWGYDGYSLMDIPTDLSDVIAISAGAQFSTALKSDGTVVAWGRNYSTSTEVPADLTNVVDIDAGQWFTLALKSDGTVVAWGRDNYSQINVPEDLANVVTISAGHEHALVLKTDGSLVSWGRNNEDQTTDPFIPEQLTFSVVCDSDGNLYDCAGVCGGDLVYDGCNFCGSPVLEGGADVNFECVCVDLSLIHI